MGKLNEITRLAESLSNDFTLCVVYIDMATPRDSFIQIAPCDIDKFTQYAHGIGCEVCDEWEWVLGNKEMIIYHPIGCKIVMSVPRD